MVSSFLVNLSTIYCTSGHLLCFTSMLSLHTMLQRDPILRYLMMKHLRRLFPITKSRHNRLQMPYLAIQTTFGIFASAMHPAQRFANIHISSQTMTLHTALHAFEPNKLANHFMSRKAKSHANSSVSIQIYVAHILHQKASLSMSSRFLMNLRTGAGLSPFLTGPQRLSVENIDISSSKSRPNPI